MPNVPTVAERNEIVQDVLDRILYLNDEDRVKFMYYLMVMKEAFPVKVNIVDGVRIYPAAVKSL